MKLSKGKADPKKTNQLLVKELEKIRIKITFTLLLIFI